MKNKYGNKLPLTTLCRYAGGQAKIKLNLDLIKASAPNIVWKYEEIEAGYCDALNRLDVSFTSNIIFNDCEGKLALKPLSSITEEEIKEIYAKTGFYNDIQDVVIKRFSNAIHMYFNGIYDDIVIGNLSFLINILNPLDNKASVVDELRLRGYDCDELIPEFAVEMKGGGK